MNDAVVFVFTY